MSYVKESGTVKGTSKAFKYLIKRLPFPEKQPAKRSPARVSLQRRVGRSASDGQPEAVARTVGRKKAVRLADEFDRDLREFVERKICLIAHQDPKLEDDYRRGVFHAFKAVKSFLQKMPADAASRRRQRALPANC